MSFQPSREYTKMVCIHFFEHDLGMSMNIQTESSKIIVSVIKCVLDCLEDVRPVYVGVSVGNVSRKNPDRLVMPPDILAFRREVVSKSTRSRISDTRVLLLPLLRVMVAGGLNGT
jgi:hypothetical protein